MEDKELKKRLAKIPDADKNGDPIYKIADIEMSDSKSAAKTREAKNAVSNKFHSGVQEFENES